MKISGTNAPNLMGRATASQKSEPVARCNPKGDEPCCSPGGWHENLEMWARGWENLCWIMGI